jgi:hypothetical protein
VKVCVLSSHTHNSHGWNVKVYVCGVAIASSVKDLAGIVNIPSV